MAGSRARRSGWALARGWSVIRDTGPMAGTPVRILAMVVLALPALMSCGSDDAAGGGPGVAGSGGWWILDAEGFILLDGGRTSDDVTDSTGHLWTLEYSDGPSTLQLSAWSEDSRFADSVDEYPVVGVAEVDGFDVTLRQSPSDPSGDISSSVVAVWADGDRLVGFGGAALSEEEVRSYLKDLRRVSRSEWNAALDEVPDPPPPPAPTTGLDG